jgi:hypothetical protein
MVSAWFSGARSGLPALLVAAVAIGLAIVWLEVSELVAVAAVVVGALLGGGAWWIGKRAVTGARPRPLRALTWLTWSALAPAAVGAGVAGAIIVLGIELTNDRWPAQTRALVAATTGALTTYLTAAFVRGAEDADRSWISGVVKQAFQAAFKDRFREGTDAARAAFSDTGPVGWDRATRRERAQTIEDAQLKTLPQLAGRSPRARARRSSRR